MNDRPKSKWYWRLLRWGLTGLAVLVTLAAVLATEENWRGKHAWTAYQRAAEARGEKLDIAWIVPPAVPDDQNFFAAPVVAEAISAEGLRNNPSALPQSGAGNTNHFEMRLWRGDVSRWQAGVGTWQKRTLTDLKPWQDYFREFSQSPAGRTNGFPISAQPQSPVEDVLLALSQFDPGIEALRQASQRPKARLPLAYEKGFEQFSTLLPWFAVEKQWIQVFGLRVSAELQAGRSQAALDDIKLSLRLIDTTRDHPYLASHLVRMAMMYYVIQPVYEGIAQHRWNDAQLADLEATLAAQDFLADFQQAMRGERTCALAFLETQRVTRQWTSVAGDNPNEMVTNRLGWMPPNAYFYQTELSIARMYDQFGVSLADPANGTISLATYRAGEEALRQLTNRFSLYRIHGFPSVSRSVLRFAVTQTQVNQARVACALERYRLANGNYPEDIGSLAPRFIGSVPHDIINGQPLHYRRTDDGGYILYSIGWNETDDGGAVVFNKEGRVNYQKGDWAWQLPSE
jgi:hypothetical protein